MPKRSAGILMYRLAPELELLLVHPGGPFWAHKDEHAWSIPKGEIEAAEDPEVAARREFAEETGMIPTGTLAPIGEVRQPGGKVIIAFGLEGDFDPATLVSNTIALQWPPRSGRTIRIPEVDRAEWVAPIEAERLLHKGQVPLVAMLRAHLGR